MEILYHDQNLVVCIKPVGLDSEHQIPTALKETFDGEIYPVHRLDLNVGGVMVYARNKTSAALLSRAIQDGKMIKEYVALVHGTPPLFDLWEDLLWKDSRKNKVFVVKRMRKGVKKAKLSFECIHSDDPSLVKIRLYTGRNHQIRVQFSSRGFPIVGDHKYGSRATEKTPMLYSYKITFPYQGKEVSFESLPSWAQ